MSVPDKRRGERIVLVTTEDEADQDALRQYGKKAGVAELMVPNDIVKVQEIPVLGSGKTDYVSTRRMAMEALAWGWRLRPGCGTWEARERYRIWQAARGNREPRRSASAYVSINKVRHNHATENWPGYPLPSAGSSDTPALNLLHGVQFIHMRLARPLGLARRSRT